MQSTLKVDRRPVVQSIMGIILSEKVAGGGGLQIFSRAMQIDCIAPLFAQCLPRHTTSKLGQSKEAKSGLKKGGQKLVCPPG